MKRLSTIWLLIVVGCGEPIARIDKEAFKAEVKAAVLSPEITSAISSHVQGTIQGTVEAEVTTVVETKMEAKARDITAVLKQEIKTEVTRELNQRSGPQSTGGWGVQVGTLNVDGLTTIIFLIAVGITAFLYLRNRKLSSLSHLLVGHNLDRGLDNEEKFKIQNAAVDKGLASLLNDQVEAEKKKKEKDKPHGQ